VDTRRRLEDLPRSRLFEQRLGFSVVPGSTRALQFIGLVRPRAGSVPPLRVSDTRSWWRRGDSNS
jgi:hypothetical protein